MDLSGDAHGKAAVGTSTTSSNHPMNFESEEKGLGKSFVRCVRELSIYQV